MKIIRFEYKIAAIYLLIGFLWIYLTDSLLEALVSDAELLTFFQSIKGSIYVGVTGLLLFVLIRRYSKVQDAARMAIQESTEKYKAIYDQSPLAFQCLDVEGRFLDINPQWTNMLGYSRDEVLGSMFEDFLHPEDARGFRLFLPLILQHKHVKDMQFRLRKKEGQYIYVSYEARMGVDPKGISQIYATFKDISEEFRTKQELIESEERYKALFHKSKSIMLLIDPETGIIIDGNQTAVKYYGYKYEELVGMKISEINTLSEEEIEVEIKKAATGKRSFFHFRHRLANGEIRHVHVYSGKINIQSKTLLFSIVHDVTRQIEAENDLVLAKDKAEESDKLKSAFLANLSHEIRTPMNGILGFTDLLRDPDLTSAQIDRYIKVIHTSGRHLLSIINDIIEISRLDTGQVSVNHGPVELNRMISEIVDELRIVIPPEKNLKIVISERVSDEEDKVNTDGVKLRQVLVNLVSNAVKYTPAGLISVGCLKKGNNKLLFRIEDTGIGIPEEFHEVIFDRFRQVDTGGKIFQSGSGLGLSISKSYIELLGGRIWLESQPEKGSVFYVEIPYVPAKGTVQKELKKISPLNRGVSGKTILIAEDDDTNFEYFLALLESTGASVIRAVNGKEAVEICEKNPGVSLVLMDLKMPVMNGYAALEKIKKFRPGLKIVAQTAYALKEDETKIMTAGFDGYITKPISKNALISTLTSE